MVLWEISYLPKKNPKVAYTAEDYNDAEFISKMLGTRTQNLLNVLKRCHFIWICLEICNT